MREVWRRRRGDAQIPSKILNGNIPDMRAEIEKICAGADVNDALNDAIVGANQFLDEEKRLRRARLAIAAGANVNGLEKTMPPLLLAVKRRNVAIVKLLIDNDANVNTPYGLYKRTALFDAVANDDEAIVELLLQSKAEIDRKDINGKTPLHHAAEALSAKAVDMLIKYKASVDAVSTDLERTPLHLAVRTSPTKIDEADASRLRIVNALLVAKANVNQQDEDLVTPLHLAAGQLHYNVVNQLLTHDVNVNAKSKTFGSTPLHDAVRNVTKGDDANERRCNIVEALIINGANVTAKTGDSDEGEMALEIARRLHPDDNRLMDLLKAPTTKQHRKFPFLSPDRLVAEKKKVTKPT